ncbi:hypothetical protein Ga0123461_1502 [Mariprofundus aestuarium]|uniref:Lipoprotein n=1 Tax=Mariprofundus aestuarium TaxID=1921086 RepID=A0A2K8L6P7_MARES|nr:hypothetical protein [Mariprofundus aestuarium]ATX79916.1 hypothetical protein Ga0123461_1502 [Mariprofundus aestuarium]
MAIKQLFLITAAMALLVAGCAHTGPEPMQSDFGNSVKTNIARQTINPDAGREQMPPATLDGQAAEKALQATRESAAEASTESLLDDVAQ